MRLKLLFLIIFAFPAFVFSQQLPNFNVEEHKITANEKRTEKMRRALSIFEQVMNDKDFQEELLQKTFHFRGTKDPHRKMTTREIVEEIYAGKESFENAADNTADIYWTVVIKKKPRTRNRTLGRGLPSKPRITTYSWFLDSSSISKLTGHIAHEWSHKLYFYHNSKFYNTKQKMFPYVFGNLVASYAKKYS